MRSSGKPRAAKQAADLLPRRAPLTAGSDAAASKVQNRARRVGFDWPDVSGALEALESESAELRRAIDAGVSTEIEEELGDLLFSAVNVSRFVHCDAEQALTRASDKFIRRFSIVEELAAARGMDLNSAAIEQMDELWEEAKKSDCPGRQRGRSREMTRRIILSMRGITRWCIKTMEVK